MLRLCFPGVGPYSWLDLTLLGLLSLEAFRIFFVQLGLA